MQPTTNNQQPTNMDDVQYLSREQELLAYLREAERAATAGDIRSMLKMQAKIHHILMDIIGNQTQLAFRVHYLDLL